MNRGLVMVPQCPGNAQSASTQCMQSLTDQDLTMSLLLPSVVLFNNWHMRRHSVTEQEKQLELGSDSFG